MKFQIGDVCITQNSKYPEVNNDQWVVIVAIDPGFLRQDGMACPYVVERLDGLPHGAITDNVTGEIRWFKSKRGNCAEYMLRKPGVGDDPEASLVDVGTSPSDPIRLAMRVEEAQPC